MLVVISDLHLSDGTCGESVSCGAFEIFAERLRELATAAGWRADDRYEPLERIDLLLLGDVLDLVRSRRWLETDQIRPWSDPHSHAFLDAATQITAGILRHNQRAVATLRELSSAGVAVPPADARGRAVHSAVAHSVPVRVHYMVGNHDWPLHLPGPPYDALRQIVASQLGLANRIDRPFAHDAAEDGELLDIFRRHRVLARHGDIFDPINFERNRDQSSLGDCIVVELVARFAADIERELGDDLPPSATLALRELDNVRPVVLVPAWIDGVLERSCPLPSTRAQVKRIWDKTVDRFLDLPAVRARDTWSPTDVVDLLEHGLKFSNGLGGAAVRVAEWLAQFVGDSTAGYARRALAEQDFRNRRARHIVYGHTHEAAVVPLDASFGDAVLEQTYFNSGTWRRVHRQTRLSPRENEFLASDVMTYLAFFAADERKGRPYEVWSGTLAPQHVDVRLHRVDAVHAADQRQPIPSAGLHQHAPHFSNRVRKAGLVPTRRRG